MPDDPYRTDIVTWSAQQAERLRRLRAGERVNDLDWDNVIEEIESVGQSQLDACRSLLTQAILHLLKRRAWPGHVASRRWLADAADFLIQAQEKYRPSMARTIDLPGVLAHALRRLPWQRFTTPPTPLPPLGAVPLQALADPDFSIEQLDAALFPPG
jgi:hypothetical protein